MWPGCCMRSVHFCCPVEGCGVNWAATEWQAVHARFPRRTEWTAPGCKCSSDNAAALLLSLFLLQGLERWTNLSLWPALWLHSILHLPFPLFIYIHMYENFLNTMLEVLLILLGWSPETHNTKAQGCQLGNSKVTSRLTSNFFCDLCQFPK